jgi:hypothetical protein
VFVECALPRTALLNPNVRTFVDGDNFNGMLTSCVLLSYDADSNLVATAAGTSGTASYDMQLTLSPAQLPLLGHTALFCSLPGQGNGRLRGVTFDF